MTRNNDYPKAIRKTVLEYLHDGNPDRPEELTIEEVTGYHIVLKFSDATDYNRFIMFINGELGSWIPIKNIKRRRVYEFNHEI